MAFLSLDESAFLKDHPWCMRLVWNEAKRQPMPCGKTGVAVVTKDSRITEWDEENWLTVCEEHYATHLKP